MNAMNDRNDRPGLPEPYVYYAEFYIKLSFSNGTDAYYQCEADMDKPVTEDFLADLLAATWKAQADSDPSRTVVAARYATRDEWESASDGTEPEDIAVDFHPKDEP